MTPEAAQPSQGQQAGTEFGLAPTTLTVVRSILASDPAVEQAVIYGSRAKGNYKPGSDIDLTLFGPQLTANHLSHLARALDESSIPYMVDLSIHADIDNPKLLTHIERVGQVFYQRLA